MDLQGGPTLPEANAVWESLHGKVWEPLVYRIGAGHKLRQYCNIACQPLEDSVKQVKKIIVNPLI